MPGAKKVLVCVFSTTPPGSTAVRQKPSLPNQPMQTPAMLKDCSRTTLIDDIRMDQTAAPLVSNLGSDHPGSDRAAGRREPYHPHAPAPAAAQEKARRAAANQRRRGARAEVPEFPPLEEAAATRAAYPAPTPQGVRRSQWRGGE